jgi:hypothetical protein
MIHEGEKCCTSAEEKLPDYVHTTWNGGCKKVKNIQGLEILKDRKCYLMPDDDQKKDKNDRLLPQESQPGFQTMMELKKKLDKL